MARPGANPARVKEIHRRPLQSSLVTLRPSAPIATDYCLPLELRPFCTPLGLTTTPRHAPASIPPSPRTRSPRAGLANFDVELGHPIPPGARLLPFLDVSPAVSSRGPRAPPAHRLPVSRCVCVGSTAYRHSALNPRVPLADPLHELGWLRVRERCGARLSFCRVALPTKPTRSRRRDGGSVAIGPHTTRAPRLKTALGEPISMGHAAASLSLGHLARDTAAA